MVKNKVKKFLKNHPNPSWGEVKEFLLSLGSKQAWGIGKKLLMQQGINVDALRWQFYKALGEEKAARAKKQGYIILYADAAVVTQRFCIASHNGRPLWFGKFFEPVANQAQAELEAAKKAVWLAGKIATKRKRVTLFLFVDAAWLCYQGPKHKASVLGWLARKYNVDLFTIHVPSEENKADGPTRSFGFKKYNLREVKALLSKGKKPKLE